MDFAHFIVTRFNRKVWGQAPAAEWMTHRWDLFDRFTYPSVRGQTCQAFQWILLCDDETRPEDRERLEAHHGIWPFYTGTAEEAMESLLREYALSPTHIIQTRLDNDDAIHKDYIKWVQAQFTGQENEFINFAAGYVWDDVEGVLRTRALRSNPFVSWIHEYDGLKSIYNMKHGDVASAGTLVQVDKPPAWLMVVHDKNRLNKARGAVIPTSQLLGFGLGETYE